MVSFFVGAVWTLKEGLGREFSEEKVEARASRFFFRTVKVKQPQKKAKGPFPLSLGLVLKVIF